MKRYKRIEKYLLDINKMLYFFPLFLRDFFLSTLSLSVWFAFLYLTSGTTPILLT